MLEINDEVSHTLAKETLKDIDLSLRHEVSIRSRSSLIWDAIGHKKRAVHDRYVRALKAKRNRLEGLLEATTCAGCGEYYDEYDVYNRTHDNNDCKRGAYRNGNDFSDNRI